MIDVGSIFSGIGSLIDSGFNIYSSKKNYELQKQHYELQKQNMQWQQNFNERQFSYQQDLNKQIMNREDTAVQRRAHDLQNAGMSKWLAAGQGASSSVLGSAGSSSAQAPSQAPFFSLMPNLQQGINGALSVYGAIANARNTEANTAQALAQADLIKANTMTEVNYRRAQIEASTDLTKQQKDNLLKEYDKLTHDLKLSQQQDIRTSDQMHSIYNSATSFVGKTFNTAGKGLNIIKGIFSGKYSK